MYQSYTIVPTEQFENHATVHLHLYQYIRQNMKLRSVFKNIMLCSYIHTVSLTILIGYLFICNVLGPIVTLRVAGITFCCIFYNNNKSDLSGTAFNIFYGFLF